MIDYILILAYGAAIVYALVAMWMGKVKVEGEGEQWKIKLSDCVEVRG